MLGANGKTENYIYFLELTGYFKCMVRGPGNMSLKKLSVVVFFVGRDGIVNNFLLIFLFYYMGVGVLSACMSCACNTCGGQRGTLCLL